MNIDLPPGVRAALRLQGSEKRTFEWDAGRLTIVEPRTGKVTSGGFVTADKAMDASLAIAVKRVQERARLYSRSTPR